MKRNRKRQLGVALTAPEEKPFPWNKLPAELKVKILRKLPFAALRNFIFLSKECMAISSKVQADVDVISFGHFPDEAFYFYECAEVGVQGYETHPCRATYDVKFSKEEDGGCRIETQVHGEGYGYHEDEPRYRDETYTTASVRAFFQIMKYVRTSHISIAVYGFSDDDHALHPVFEKILSEQPLPALLACKTFCIDAREQALTRLLPKLLAPGCGLAFEYDFFYDGHIFPDIFPDSAFFETELVRRAPHFFMLGNAGITDNGLLLMQAPYINFGAPLVTAKGVNVLIKQWLDGKRQLGKIVLKSIEEFHLSDIIDGLDAAAIVPKMELTISRRGSDESGSDYEDDESSYAYPEFSMGIRNSSGDILGIVLEESEYCILLNPYNQCQGRFTSEILSSC